MPTLQQGAVGGRQLWVCASQRHPTPGAHHIRHGSPATAGSFWSQPMCPVLSQEGQPRPSPRRMEHRGRTCPHPPRGEPECSLTAAALGPHSQQGPRVLQRVKRLLLLQVPCLGFLLVHSHRPEEGILFRGPCRHTHVHTHIHTHLPTCSAPRWLLDLVRLTVNSARSPQGKTPA